MIERCAACSIETRDYYKSNKKFFCSRCWELFQAGRASIKRPGWVELGHDRYKKGKLLSGLDT